MFYHGSTSLYLIIVVFINHNIFIRSSGFFLLVFHEADASWFLKELILEKMFLFLSLISGCFLYKDLFPFLNSFIISLEFLLQHLTNMYLLTLKNFLFMNIFQDLFATPHECPYGPLVGRGPPFENRWIRPS